MNIFDKKNLVGSILSGDKEKAKAIIKGENFQSGLYLKVDGNKYKHSQSGIILEKKELLKKADDLDRLVIEQDDSITIIYRDPEWSAEECRNFSKPFKVIKTQSNV